LLLPARHGIVEAISRRGTVTGMKLIKRKPGKRDWINIAVILVLAGLFVWFGVAYTKTFGQVQGEDLLSTAENLRAFILSYGGAGILVMILMHAVQVIISFIPSVGVQFVGGMIYGMPLGMLTSLIGIPLGTAVSFYLSRLFGRRLVTLFVSEKNLQRLEGMLASDTSSLILLALFILPTPKDFFAYFVGLTDMKASKFFLISTAGRIPGMLIATYLGAHIFDRNYVMIAGVAVASSLLLLAMYIFKDRLLAMLARRPKV